MRYLLTLIGAALVLAPAATAHVTANPGSATAGEFTKLDFRVPHGCDGSPTTSLTVRMPEGVLFVAPEVVPGWKESVTTAKFSEPVEVFGETHTEGVRTVTWRGGPLPEGRMLDFGVSLRLPEGAGKTLYFPSVQRCVKGVHRWITIPVEGQEEPEAPAPGVELIATEATEEEQVMPAPAPVEESDDSDDRANLALGFGIGGLVVGLAAVGLSLWRRPRSA
jgi:periplasmic copper chaperone A